MKAVTKDSLEIAARLRVFMETNFKSNNAFAAALGVAPASLSGQYLSGKVSPSGHVLINLVIMGCDANWLLIGTGMPSSPSPEEAERCAEHFENRARYLRNVASLERQRRDMEERGYTMPNRIPGPVNLSTVDGSFDACRGPAKVG